MPCYALQELCLQLRLAPLLAELDIRAAFARCLEAPPPAAVSAAIVALQRSAALDAREQLTPLGRHLARLPVDICIGRLMIFGAILRCAHPVLLIAAALSDRSPFLSPLARRDEARAAQLCFNTDQSDHLAAVAAYNAWHAERDAGGAHAARRFCERHFLSERTLSGMGDAADQFWGQLAELGLLPNVRALRGGAREAARRAANAHSDSALLLKAVLAAGLSPNYLLVSGGRKGKPQLAQQKQSVAIHPSSFNHGAKRFDTSYLVYHEKVKTTGKIWAHDCSTITALDLLLFAPEPHVLHAQHRVTVDGWIDLRVSPRTAVLFKSLRAQLSELLRRTIERSGEAAAAEQSAAEEAQAAVVAAIVSLIKRGVAAAELDDG